MESGTKDTENYTIKSKAKLDIIKIPVTFVEHGHCVIFFVHTENKHNDKM